MKKRSQSGIEYMIIIGFVSVAITVVLLSAYFYIGMSKDKIRENQLEVFADKILSSAESVFYAGEPSQVTITVYVPSGITSITFSGTELIVTASTSAGQMKRAFSSKVNITGSINSGEGSKNLIIKAQPNTVIITQK